MASKKADFDGLMVQEFLTKAQAMAYTNMLTEAAFDEKILPYVHTYQTSDGRGKGDFYLPELRKRKLQLVVAVPTKTM